MNSLSSRYRPSSVALDSVAFAPPYWGEAQRNLGAKVPKTGGSLDQESEPKGALPTQLPSVHLMAGLVVQGINNAKTRGVKEGSLGYGKIKTAYQKVLLDQKFGIEPINDRGIVGFSGFKPFLESRREHNRLQGVYIGFGISTLHVRHVFVGVMYLLKTDYGLRATQVFHQDGETVTYIGHSYIQGTRIYLFMEENSPEPEELYVAMLNLDRENPRQCETLLGVCLGKGSSKGSGEHASAAPVFYLRSSEELIKLHQDLLCERWITDKHFRENPKVDLALRDHLVANGDKTKRTMQTLREHLLNNIGDHDYALRADGGNR